MRRFAGPLFAVCLTVRPSFAQLPSLPWPAYPPAPQAAVAQVPGGRAFDPDRLEVRQVDGRWLILAGGAVLKDCGNSAADARAVLRVIRLLGLTQHAAVGHPVPVMEYWLSHGRPPHSTDRSLRLVPLDLNTLGVESAQGPWVLRDATRVLFSFAAREDAQHALDVIRHYGFNALGVVGEASPVMVYFLASAADAERRPTLAPPPAAKGAANGSAPGLPAPPTATKRIEARHAVVRSDRGEWKLIFGGETLANFGPSQQDANLAWNVLQHYRPSEHCTIGGASPSFSYFLVNGQAPRGLRFGMLTVGFRPEAVVVRQVGRDWAVCDGERALVNFGDRRDDAVQLAEAIRRHRFDHVCRIGGASGYGMYFLVKGR